jgi:nucleotide-binding universal stress UspA family protein
MMNWVVSTIVVPSDGSASVDHALAAARSLARSSHGRVLVLPVGGSAESRPTDRSTGSSQVILAAERQVNELRDAGVRAELAPASALRAAAIADATRQLDADLTVLSLAMLDKNSARNTLISELVASSADPILVVPEAPAHEMDANLGIPRVGSAVVAG